MILKWTFSVQYRYFRVFADAKKSIEEIRLVNRDKVYTATSFQCSMRNGSVIIAHSPGDGNAVVELPASSKQME